MMLGYRPNKMASGLKRRTSVWLCFCRMRWAETALLSAFVAGCAGLLEKL